VAVSTTCFIASSARIALPRFVWITTPVAFITDVREYFLFLLIVSFISPTIFFLSITVIDPFRILSLHLSRTALTHSRTTGCGCLFKSCCISSFFKILSTDGICLKSSLLFSMESPFNL